MTWSDVTRPPKPKVVRQFAVISFVLLTGFGFFQALARAKPTIGWGCVIAGAICLVLGFTVPSIFRWVFTASMLLAFPIGFVVSQVMLAVLFFGVFLSIGLMLRARGSDPMGRRRKTIDSSYWEPKVMPTDSRRYLRQY